MTSPRSAIPVLRFHAGPLNLGIAAEDVQGVGLADGKLTHIALLLGVEPGHGELERRVIWVATGIGAEALAFEADPPVEVVRCSASDVLPIAPGVPQDCWDPVMGFAHIDDQPVLLLDIPSLAKKLLEHQEKRGSS